MTRIDVLISPNLGAEPEPPAVTLVQAAHQTPRLTQSSSRRRVNSLPEPALARPPLGDLTWAALSGSPARSLHPHSRAWLARGCFSELLAPGGRRGPLPLPGRASRPDCTRGRGTRARLARDLGRAGFGGGAVTGVPGTPRHAPCAAHPRPARPLTRL